jgi:hypothetical protein
MPWDGSRKTASSSLTSAEAVLLEAMRSPCAASILMSARSTVLLLLPAATLVLGACTAADGSSGDWMEARCEDAGHQPDTAAFDDCYRAELQARGCAIAGYSPGSYECLWEQQRIRAGLPRMGRDHR